MSSQDIWVLVERCQGEIQDVSLQLVSGTRHIAEKIGRRVCAVVIGGKDQDILSQLANYGADRILFLDSPLLLDYSADLHVETLADLYRDENPELILCGATPMGNDLAPRLAAKLKTGHVSDCVSIEVDPDGSVSVIKPTYGGKVYSRMGIVSARPGMVTVKPDAMEAKALGRVENPIVSSVVPRYDGNKSGVETKYFIKGDPKTIDIEEADIIVSGGRGMGDGNNFKVLEDLAEVLGASLAGSLAAVDAGWISSERQVGQTGKTVAPRLYIACGISGASYHTLGMEKSGAVIAINVDRHAPIFKLADVGIVGDALKIVPEITSKLKEITKNSADVPSDEIAEVFKSV